MAEGYTRKIELRVSNQKAYVWDLDGTFQLIINLGSFESGELTLALSVDLASLRADHHICGVLAGTLPHLSQQNVFLGVPLVLLPEEVVLLVRKRMSRGVSHGRCPIADIPGCSELAVLVDDPTAHREPEWGQMKAWNAERIALVNAQLAATEARDVSEKQSSRIMSEEALKKRKEREERRLAAARAKAAAEGTELPDETTIFAPSASTSSGVDTAQPTQDPLATPATGASTNANATWGVTVPADSEVELSWYSADGATYETIEAAKAAGIWSYPSTPFEHAKCEVFRDLWEKGNYMGGGIRFGGDFLVYPGAFSMSILRSISAKLILNVLI